VEKRVWGIFIPPVGAARSVMESSVEAFRSYGESVTAIDTKKYAETFEKFLAPESKDLVDDITNQSWVCKAVEEGWNHVLVGALSPVTNWTLKLLKKLNIVTVFWFYEDYRKVSYWQQQLGMYDLFCAVQKEPLESVVGKSFRFLPTAASTVVNDPIPDWNTRPYDCAFVGIPSPYRIAMLTCLKDAGLSLTIAGSGWEQVPQLREQCAEYGWISAERSAQLYSSARFGINLSQENPFEDDLQAFQISPRLYDMALAGTLPVTELLPLGETLFRELSTVLFDSAESMIAGICETNSLDIDQAILEDNRQCILAKHLYRHRVEQIVTWTASL